MILFLTPLFFGGVRPLIIWLLICAIGLVGIVYFFRAKNAPEIQLQHWEVVGLVYFFGVLPAHAVLISIWPPDELYSSYEHLKTTALIFAYTIYYFLMRASFAGKSAERLLVLILVSSVGFALYGLINFYAGNDKILWFEKAVALKSLSSTFVNRNNYATFAGLGLTFAIAVFLRFGMGFFSRQHGLEEQRFFGGNTLAAGPLLLSGILIISIALILTGSRAGILLALMGVVALVALCLWRYKAKRKGLLVLAVFSGLFVVLAVWLGGDFLLARLKLSVLENDRWALNRIMLQGVLDRPLLGSGFGSFDDLYARLRDIENIKYYVRGHNDWLELAISVGVIAAAVPFALTLYVIYWFVRRAFIATGSHVVIIFLGAVSTFQLAANAGVDFPLQIPGIVIYYLSILAAATNFAERVK
jgi:hypothetical protein